MESDWTRVWTEEARPVVALRYFPLSVRGFVTLAREGAERVGRRLRRGSHVSSGRATDA